MSESIRKSEIDTHKEQNTQLNCQPNQRFEHLGIHSEKEPQRLFGNLSTFEQRQLLENLKLSYSLILFDCLASKKSINQKIEVFVKEAFSISLPIDKVIEIHNNLIDTLDNQLKLEGLRFEHLSYFRLTLINIVVHLGKMYSNVVIVI